MREVTEAGQKVILCAVSFQSHLVSIIISDFIHPWRDRSFGPWSLMRELSYTSVLTHLTDPPEKHHFTGSHLCESHCHNHQAYSSVLVLDTSKQQLVGSQPHQDVSL